MDNHGTTFAWLVSEMSLRWLLQKKFQFYHVDVSNSYSTSAFEDSLTATEGKGYLSGTSSPCGPVGLRTRGIFQESMLEGMGSTKFCELLVESSRK
jgi:hypothetical protein